MALFGSHQRKAFAKIETGLIAKYTARTSTGTVTFIATRVNNMPEKLKILLHKLQVKPLSAKAGNQCPVFNNKIAVEMWIDYANFEKFHQKIRKQQNE